MTIARAAVAFALVAAGVVVSPLSVVFVVAIAALVVLAGRGLDADERRWVTVILVFAIALRVAAVLILFLSTDHRQVPFGTMFGDEDYFIRRSLWLLNVARGVPIHPIDLEYAFEPNGRSSFLYMLAFIQMITGPAPYGLHLIGIFCFVAGAIVLHRVARRAFGRMPALLGLIVLLFLPSLFAWSIAVLKESIFVLAGAVTLWLSVAVVRAPSRPRQALAAAAIVALVFVQGTIRQGGATFSASAVALGLSIAFVVTRPRMMVAAMVALPIAGALILREPDTQLRAYAAIQRLARQHWGAVVVSQGKNYQLLDPRFYADINEVSSLTLTETAQYVVRGAASFVMVPLPWEAQSGMTAAYIPEQIVWYVLAMLVPAGVVFGLRRDPLLTGLLIAHAVLIAAASALTDGNVGTLVRHRGLALPYLVWLGACGACWLLLAWTRPTPFSEVRSQ